MPKLARGAVTPAAAATLVKCQPVVEEQVVAAEDGHEEVGPAVVVVVPADDSLHEADDGDAGLRGDVAERPVAFVVVELARMLVARRRLVPHEEVEPAVSIVVEPGRGLGRGESQQARLAGHVREGAVAVVAEER